MAVKIAILFSAISPSVWPAIKEVCVGLVPLQSSFDVVIVIVALGYAMATFWKISDAVTIAVYDRFVKKV